MSTRHTGLIGAVLLSGAFLLGACSSHSSSGSGSHSAMNNGSPSLSIPTNAEFNATDVGFAQGMIPHHGQAIEMADMAVAANAGPQVLALAERIKAAQNPEIQTMSTWLRQWNQTVPDVAQGSMANDSHDMADMGGMMMDGMMSKADMTRLAASKDAAYDRLWVELMIQHHEGAVRMAKDEVAEGKDPAARALASSIVISQETEIREMNALLLQLPK